jgi:hypothetical protein
VAAVFERGLADLAKGVDKFLADTLFPLFLRLDRRAVADGRFGRCDEHGGLSWS